MDLRVLGSLEVVEEGRQLPLGGLKQRTVLALLVANVGQPVSTDALVDGVYGEEASPGARRSVQTYVSNLRGQLGEMIRATGSGYTLTAERSEVDALRFEDLCAAADGVDPDHVADQLREALAIWRGHPYADVDGLGPIATEVTRLNELRMVAVERRIDAELDAGRHGDLVAELEALAVEHPFRERLRAQQMLALYRSGRQAEALRAYEKARTHLVEEMGLDPSPELRDLERQILDHDQALSLTTRPTIRRAAILIADVADPGALSGTDPEARGRLADRHAVDITAAVGAHGGEVFAHRGTALYSMFEDTQAAAAAAEQAQWAFVDIEEPGLRVRMAIDVGDVERDATAGVQGPPVSRVAALVAGAHGGQVVLSGKAHAELTAKGGEWETRGLGTPTIEGIEEPMPVHQLNGAWLTEDFTSLRSDTILPAPPGRGPAMPGYEWRGKVGAGVFGVVYRGYQPSVGREVAIKEIRPELANHASFVRRFEVEAQLVARLEHPHIVPLYDYWRDADGAFLVMRWMRGGNLSERLGGGALGVVEATRLVSQIGPALATAHRNGVIHRDLRPENVLLDEEGNAYLTDFGIAVVDGQPGFGASPQIDIRDLGLLIRDCVGESDLGTTPELAAVIDRAVTEDPDHGYTDVAALITAWDGAAGGVDPVALSTFTETRNPYKGLSAFSELDTADFHGRDGLVGQLVQVVGDHRLVGVVGPSGIGKSSVMRAGLIPAIRGGGLSGSERWLIADMVPSAYPFERLAHALERVATRQVGDLEDQLRKDRRGLMRATQRYLPQDATLLLVIDQFEELFTLTASEEARTAFLDLLSETASDERSGVRIVLTLRADFFDRPLRYPEFGELLRAGTVPISAPTDDELREIVVSPAAEVGITFEAGLADRILGDVSGQPGTLPLLEFALTRLFDNREVDAISAADYDGIGGVLAALGRRAEQVFATLDQTSKEVARQVFLRLVNVSEGGRDTRRRVRMTELARLGFAHAELQSVVDAFVEDRLLTTDRDPVTRGPTVEVAHEALITEWPRLAEWIEGQREDLLLHSRLSVAVTDWEDSDRADTYLLRAGRLDQHEAWTIATELSLTSGERGFLESSRAAEEGRRAQRRRVRRRVMAGFGAAAVVATVLAVIAGLAQRREADSADLATSRALAASAVGVVAEDPELSLMLALSSVAVTETSLSIETEEAIRAALSHHRTLFYREKPTEFDLLWTSSAALSPDGELVAITWVGNRLEMWAVDSISDEPLWDVELPYPGGLHMEGPRFSKDGRWIAASAYWWDLDDVDPSIPELPPDDAHPGFYVWDARTGDLVRRIESRCVGWAQQRSVHYWDPGLPIVLNPDTPLENDLPANRECDTGGSADGIEVVTVLDMMSGQVINEVTVPADTGTVTLAVDPSQLVVARAGGRTELWDIATARYVEDTPDHRDLSLDGTRYLGGDPLAIREVASGNELAQVPSDLPVTFLSADGEGVVTVGATVIDARGNKINLAGHDGLVLPFMTTSADGSRVATSSSDLTARVWNLDPIFGELGGYELPPGFRANNGMDVVGHVGVAIVYPASGPWLFDLFNSFLTHQAEGSLLVFDHESGAMIREIPGVGGKVTRLSPDGTQVAVQAIVDDHYGPVRLLDVQSGRTVVEMEGLCPWSPNPTGQRCADGEGVPAGAIDLDFNPDGSLLAMAAGEAQRLMVWETTSGEEVLTTDRLGNTYAVSAVQFSPSGSLLAASSKQGTWVFETGTWSQIAFLPHTGKPAWALRFTPDGGLLLQAQAHTGDVAVWDTQSWELRGTFEAGVGQIRDMEIDALGEFVVTAHEDGVVAVHEIESGDLMHLVPVDGDVTNVELVDDDRHLLVLTAWGPSQLITLDTAELLSIARGSVVRGFTAQECQQFALDPCPTRDDVRAGL